MYPGAMYWWKRARHGGCGGEADCGPAGAGAWAGGPGGEGRWAHGGGDWGEGGGAFGVRRLVFVAFS